MPLAGSRFALYLHNTLRVKEEHVAEVVRITYCIEWNYLPVASSLAAAIKDKFGMNTELIEGHGGILKVTMNDTVMYDNLSKCGQLPTKEDVIRGIEKLKR